MWNALAPPAHGETVMYVCDAGTTYNRFESNFNKWNYTLTCQEKNVFSEEPDVPWPTCVDSKIHKQIHNKNILFSDVKCSNLLQHQTSEINMRTEKDEISYTQIVQ